MMHSHQDGTSMCHTPTRKMHQTLYLWSKLNVHLKQMYSTLSLLCIFQDRLTIIVSMFHHVYRITYPHVIFFLAQVAGCAVCVSSDLNATSQNALPEVVYSDKWEAVNITYKKDFPYSSQGKIDSSGCIKVSVFLHNKKKRLQLRCNENIKLLRPGSVVDKWADFQKKKVTFSLL